MDVGAGGFGVARDYAREVVLGANVIRDAGERAGGRKGSGGL